MKFFTLILLLIASVSCKNAERPETTEVNLIEKTEPKVEGIKKSEKLIEIAQLFYKKADFDSVMKSHNFKKGNYNYYFLDDGIYSPKASSEMFNTSGFLSYKVLERQLFDSLRFDFDKKFNSEKFFSYGDVAYKYTLSKKLSLEAYENEKSMLGTNERYEFLFIPTSN